MKKSFKVLAVALSLILAMSLLPMAAMAAQDELESVTIKGEAVTLPTPLPTTIEDAIEKTVELALSPAQLASDTEAEATIETGGSGIATIKLFADGDDSAVGVVTDIATEGVVLTDQALIPGAVIWVADTEGNVVRILINQKDGGTIPGDSAVKNAILNVVLPTSLNFTLDPLQLTPGAEAADTQVATADYRIANKSNSPVKVTFNIVPTLKNGVTFVESPAKLPPTGVSKNAYFAVLGANSVTGSPTFSDPSLGTMVYSRTNVLSEVAFPEDGTSAASIAFLLGKADAATLATNNDGVASFRFYGQLNARAVWVANDITVNGAYTLQALKASDYTTLKLSTTGLNLLPADGPVIFGSIAEGGDILLTVVRAEVAATVDAVNAGRYDPGVSVLLANIPEEVTGVKNNVTNFVFNANTNDYLYDEDTGIFTFRYLPNADIAQYVITGKTGATNYTYTLTIVFK